MKSLIELFTENNAEPFDAVSNFQDDFHCVEITPNGYALGWDYLGRPDYYNGNIKVWSFKNESNRSSKKPDIS